MVAITWDGVGERLYETGVDHGVLYIPDGTELVGEYAKQAFAWNGLTTVTESPSGAEASPQYADNIKYLNLISAEEFGATIEAFTYPPEFGACDGTASPKEGVTIGQQARKPFGFAYRTRIGNDVEADSLGYKLHIVYGALAAPTEKAYATVNDSPEAATFSWEVTTSPVAFSPTGSYANLKPTALITLDSTKIAAADMLAIEKKLYGDGTTEAVLPLPDAILALITAA